MIAPPDTDGDPAGGNTILIASDRPLPAGTGSDADGAGTYDRRQVEELVGDAESLRDDYAPVDQLLTSHR